MYQNFILLYHIYMKLNMFWVTHHPSSGAKTALAASGYSYAEGCWTCRWWTLSGTVLCLTTSTDTSSNLLRCQAQYCVWQHPPTTHPTAFYIWKTRGCKCSFRLLMMGGVSPETCWAS